ncbi:MAG: SRPBCC family protein [Gaiellaceae bacterium]
MSTATEKAEDVAEQGKEKVSGNGDGNLAKKFLLPAAAGVGAIAAGYAAKKAPDLFSDQVMPKLEQRGSDEAAKVGKQAMGKMTDGSSGVMGKVAGSVVDKVTGGGGGGKGKKTRRLPIQRWTDVAVPIDKAYQAWTDFEKFPQFMHRVLSVEKSRDGKDELQWEEKIWFSKRQWKGKVVERRKNDRIAWKTTSGTQHSGIVSFHKLDENLTRVMVEVDFQPTGMFEKMGSGLRFVKRAVQADLARFKAYVEMKDVKGLDYSPEKGNDNGDEDDKNDKKDKKASGSSNGQSRSSSESEQERKERAERRKQRQA